MSTITTILQNRKRVLGRNERYLNFIRPSNKSRAIKIADDKILTKKILKKHNIPVTKQLGVIKNRRELERFDFGSLPKSFVVKPVRGVRGGGVEIFYNRDKDGNWIKSDGSRFTIEDIKLLCRDILDGKYSLFNEPDTVLIEERIRAHKNFKYYAYKGAADIRVIVYNKVPVMSYVRLPTKESQGKANLDKGAIAAGIDMAVGKTTNSIIGKSTKIEYLPEYGLPLSGLKIPYWDRILRYAAEASVATGLGFGAIDFLIDKELGPLIVELNARPGLSIQLANDDGLRWRLKKTGDIKVTKVEKGVRLAKDLFGGEIEEEIEEISGKQVIGLIENVNIYGKDDKSELVKAKIDTGATISSIDVELAKELGFKEAIEYAQSILSEIPQTFSSIHEAKEYATNHNLNERLEQHPDIQKTAIVKASNGITYRIQLPMKLEISDFQIDTYINVADRSNLLYKVIIGKRDLKKFLIDPAKRLKLKWKS